MKRWALMTIALYLLCLSICAVPLILLFSRANEAQYVISHFFAYVIPVLVLVQIALLSVPMDIAKDRPVKKRKVVVSAILGAMLMGVMAGWFFLSIAFMIWGEELGTYKSLGIIASIAVFWIVWGILFWRNFASKGGDGFLSTMTGWLLKGSIMEMLVAVPSHILSRHRNDCCAPVLTLGGLVTGLSVAFLSFGPGLFAERLKKKKGNRA